MRIDPVSQYNSEWDREAERQHRIRERTEQLFEDYWKHDMGVTDWKLALDNDDDHTDKLHKALVSKDHAEIGRIFSSIVEAQVWQYCEDRAANEIDDDILP